VSPGVIELDLSEPWESELPLAPWRPGRFLRVWLAPILVTLAALIALTGATPAQRFDPVLVVRQPNIGLVFGADDVAYLAVQRLRGGRLQAYLPGRTAPLWTVDMPGVNPVPIVTDDPDVLVVMAYQAEPGLNRSESVLQGRDSRTGQLRWTRPTDGAVLRAGTVLLVIDMPLIDPNDLPDEDGDGDGSTPDATPLAAVVAPLGPRDGPALAGLVRAIDWRTGDVRWSHRLAAGARIDPMGDGPDGLWSTFIELSRDGVLDIVDTVSGDVRSTVRLKLVGRPLSVARRDGYVIVHQVDPAAAVAQYPIEEGTVTYLGRPVPDVIGAYDMATGAERWRTPGGGPAMIECGGRYLCRYEPDATTVTDPQTGVRAYEGPGDAFVFRGDQLYVSRRVGPGPRDNGTAVYQLDTGRLVRMYPDWRLASGDLDGLELFAQTDFKGRFTVAVLDPRTRVMRVLGVADDWFGDAVCSMGRRYVGCTGPAGLRVWKLAPQWRDRANGNGFSVRRS
jgi:hypothetical protein